MSSDAPKLLDAEQAARALEKTLAGRSGPLSIADAAAASGLALRDAERGLHALVSTYRGHLRVTEQGELLFLFPTGFTKPWETRGQLRRALGRMARALEGALRFVVRAWISIVLLGYAALFVALFLGLMFARQRGDSRRNDFGGAVLVHVFFRIVFEALFWTFHPFSPVALATYPTAWTPRAPAPKSDRGAAFYDRVNRFFFGPPTAPEDPRAIERTVLAEIRSQKGRIGLADVMRVTGLPRDEADPLMARLMLDYDGTVEVSEEGGISYSFASVRKTGTPERADDRPLPVWSSLAKLAPLTGNSASTNVLIAALNGFNLIASLYAIDQHLTLQRLGELFSRVPPNALHAQGTAIALGIVPFVFSLALFALPLARAAARPFHARALRHENGRRSMLRAVLSGVKQGGVAETPLREAWRAGAGEDPDPKELTREVVRLGGDSEVADDGRTRYRFLDLEAEAAALDAEREAASEEEARVGPVIFTSEPERQDRPPAPPRSGSS